MKRNNKKGFTIVELVIVIAVIAILSAVLIPTFGGIVEQAGESARDQEAKNLLTEYMITAPSAELGAGVDGYIVVDGYFYEVADNNLVELEAIQKTDKPTGEYKVLKCNDHTAGGSCAKCGK